MDKQEQYLSRTIQELEERLLKQEILIRSLRGEIEELQGWVTHFEEKELDGKYPQSGCDGQG